MHNLYLVGDLHGEFGFLPNILKDVPNDATIVQVGDFGVYRSLRNEWEKVLPQLDRFKNPIYFIDGNHEEFPIFYDVDTTVPRNIWPKLTWIPRGTVMEINGLRVGFMGGAASPDKALRKEGMDWWPQEAISYGEFERMVSHSKVDLLVTHSPPESIVKQYFRHPAFQYPAWKLSPKWRDWSAVAVEKIWEHLEFPPIVCGHFHSDITHRHPVGNGEYSTVRILDIAEVLKWE